MKIEWLGHAAFLVSSDQGVRILTDPYDPGCYGEDFGYRPIRVEADIVLVSHTHGDHFGPKSVPAGAKVVRDPGEHEVKGIPIKGILTCHDQTGGRQRGVNTVFCFTVDEVRLCHLGDLGHELSRKEIATVGSVDVLMIPVGGFYTIDANEAARVVRALVPKVVLPMHYQTRACRPPSFPIAGVEDFLKTQEHSRRLDASEVELSRSTLPFETETWVLNHAL